MTSSTLKVLMVNSLYAPRQVGGAEKSVQVLCEALAAVGHQVHVVTLNDGPAIVRRNLNGVAVSEWPIRNLHWPFSTEKKPTLQRLLWHVKDVRNTAYDALFNQLVEETQPDVIHTHNLAGFSTRIWQLAKRKRLPVVHTLRDYYLSCPVATRYKHDRNCTVSCPSCRPFEILRRTSTRNVDAVVGISQFILDDHLNRGFFAGTPIKTVLGNTAMVKPLTRTDVDRHGSARTFGYLGMLTPSKGIEHLLEAFVAVAPSDARLLIGGTGETAYVDSLRRRYRHPGIHFLGFVAPATVYTEADVVVVPSLWNEPFSRVAMEAALHGIPIIASARGGLAEIASLSGATLFDPDQSQSLINAFRSELFRETTSEPRLRADDSLIRSTFDSMCRADDYASIYCRVAA